MSIFKHSFLKKLHNNSKKSNVIAHKYSACLLSHKNKILAISPNSQDDVVRVIGRRRKVKIPSMHAEVAVIVELFKKIKQFRKNSDKRRRQTVDMVVLQFRANGEMMVSKPCQACMEFIKKMSPYIKVRKIYYYGEMLGYQNETFRSFDDWETVVKSMKF